MLYQVSYTPLEWLFKVVLVREKQVADFFADCKYVFPVKADENVHADKRRAIRVKFHDVAVVGRDALTGNREQRDLPPHAHVVFAKKRALKVLA